MSHPQSRPAIALLFVICLMICGPSSAAQSLDCSSLQLPTEFPFLAESSDWNQPGYYSTIQTADINGDGHDALIARYADGIHEWTYDSPSGTWIEVADAAPILSDAQGWNEPQYYSTIQFAVLNPQLKQEDLIARAGDGVHVYRWNATSKQWNDLNPSDPKRPYPDSGDPNADWTEDEFYSTIHAGHFGGKPWIFGRGRNGLNWYSWNEATKTWTYYDGDHFFPDSDGWGEPQYWSTLQLSGYATGGDPGNQTIVIRSSTGLQFWSYSAKTGWSSFQLDAFSDADGYGAGNEDFYSTIRTFTDPGAGKLAVALALNYLPGGVDEGIDVYGLGPFEIALPGGGWKSESQYSTVQAADIDNDGQMEILARASDGLHAFHRNGATWSELASLPQLSDANGFALRSEYFTIQTAHEASGTVVIARGLYGISTFQFNPAQNTWNYTSSLAGFPGVATPQQHDAYRFISGAVLPGSTDIRSQYTSTDIDWSNVYSNIRSCTPANCNGVAYTGTDSAADFASLTQQLKAEVFWVPEVQNFFVNSKSFYDTLFATDQSILTWTAGQIDISTENPNATAFNDASLGLRISSSIAGLTQIPGLPAVLNILSAGFAAGAASSGGSLTVPVNNIAGDILQLNKITDNANACVETNFLQSWALMKPMGTGIDGNNWGNIVKDQSLHDSAETGFEAYTYQSLVPLAWKVLHAYYYGVYPYDQCVNTIPDGYELAYSVPYQNPDGCTGAWFSPPSNAIMDNLFANGPCPNCPTVNQLGVDPKNLFYGLDGWDLPGTLPQPVSASTRDREEKARKDAVKAIKALSDDVTGTVVNPAALQSLVSPLAQAVQFLQPQTKQSSEREDRREKDCVLTRTQIQQADQMIEIFTTRERQNSGVTLTAAISARQLSSAYIVRNMLEKLAEPSPRFPVSAGSK